MKKVILLPFILLHLVSFSQEKNEAEETRDIRKYHQQLEERVFELEDEEVLDEKVKEALSHGKRRISDLKKNLLQELEYEGKDTSEKLEEVKILEEKYEIVLKEIENLFEEKERLIKENEYYKSKLNEL